MLKTLFKDYKNLANIDTHWLIIWVLIYISFLSFDIINPNFFGTLLLKYTGIFLCVVYTWRKYRNDTYLIFAILLTLLADTVLVWTPWVEVGTGIFCLAQFFHLLRFNREYEKQIIILGLFAILFFGIYIMTGLPALYALAISYALLLIINLYRAAVRYKKEPNEIHNRYGLYGFICFICCDICVGLRFLMLDGHLNTELLPLVAYLVWFFYYPSQVMIANSSDQKQITKASSKIAK